jgi:ATP-dependent Lon protease
MSEDDSDSDEDSVSSSEYKSKLRKSTRKSKPISEEEDEESSNKESEGSELDDSDQDDSESEEEATDDDDDDDDDSDYEDDVKSATQRIGLMISNFGAPKDNNQPKKFKMKEQPPIVKKFVKLVQQETSNEDQSNNIDTDISYFKQLSDSKQNMIIDKMERKFSVDETTVPIKFKILEKQVPAQVEKLALSKYNALMNMDTSSTEYYKGFHWIEGYSNMPLGVYKDLPVKLEDGQEACSAFVTKVRQNMDEAIYGHDEAKLQILQFVSSWIANPKGIGNVVSIHGPMGVGKTTLVKNGIAKALDRPFHFISLGGASDASFLDGHSYTYEGSTWGRIADILIQSKCMNPIIYFDELDKISETPKGEEIMNLLIHITDGSQNDRFQDKYFTGIDLDLSRCLFIFSHNNHERVSPILRDRMYNIRVSGFNLKEKQVIAEQYLIEQTLKEIGLFEKLSISQDVVQHIVEEYTGDEKGVRELKRCIHTVMSKLNLLRFYNDPKKVPFAIADFSLPFILKKEHLKLLLKKPAEEDQSWKSLYN